MKKYAVIEKHPSNESGIVPKDDESLLVTFGAGNLNIALISLNYVIPKKDVEVVIIVIRVIESY